MTEEETTGQEFNLRDYYLILMKRKRLVILLTMLGLLFTAAVVLHIAAALYHGLVRKDGVLGRMI